MNEPLPAESSRACPACKAENWPSARFCAECGARLVAEDDLERAFESTVADVIENTDEPEVPAQSGGTESLGAPALEEGSSAQVSTAWPASVPPQAPRSRNTTVWIVLGIFAFILVCCCGLTLVIAIASANDSALHRELTHYARAFSIAT